MDYIAFGEAYFHATGVFVSVLRGSKPVYSSLSKQLDIKLMKQWPSVSTERSPCFCSMDGEALYGMIHVENTEWTIMLGPVFSVEVSDGLFARMMDLLSIPHTLKAAFSQQIRKSLTLSPAQMAKHIELVYFSVHGKPVADRLLYQADGAEIPEMGGMEQRIDQLESGELHNSYYFEVEMYQKVREGNTAQLERFFRENNYLQLNEGLMAKTPLRHAKNVFITTVSRVGFIGAIPGGLDVEKTYQLMDYYIRECERLATVKDVAKLQYTMVFDFCERTGEFQRPANISSDVWHCMNHVRSHIYDTISVGDVAHSLKRSVSYIQKRFRNELHTSVSHYILRSKLEEAKTLLVYTEKSLTQISCDLCFSSQSHFQRVFKKEYGITPAQYREAGRTI